VPTSGNRYGCSHAAYEQIHYSWLTPRTYLRAPLLEALD
jgi:hypothetical protein